MLLFIDKGYRVGEIGLREDDKLLTARIFHKA